LDVSTYKVSDKELFWIYVMFGLPLVTIVIRLLLLLFYFKYETPKYYV